MSEKKNKPKKPAAKSSGDGALKQRVADLEALVEHLISVLNVKLNMDVKNDVADLIGSGAAPEDR